MTSVRCFAAITVLLASLPAGGCRDGEENGGARSAAATPERAAATPPPSNRIDVPPTVRQNLGITFARVERRRVASTIRVPGRFELLPSARREYRSTLPGWVHLLVGQYDTVDQGTPLYRIASPEWHRLRKQLHESQAAIEAATAELAVAERSKAEAEAVVRALEQRAEALAGAEVRRAELETELATRRASIPRLDAEVRVKQAALNEARHDFALDVDTAAALLGVSAEVLTQTVEEPARAPAAAAAAAPGDAPSESSEDATEEPGEANAPAPVPAEYRSEHKVQRWYAISRIDQRASGPGVVEALHATDGTWVDGSTLVATTINPAALRFRATGLQSDLGRLRDGLAASVIPPQGSGIDGGEALPGRLKVGLTGDPDRRTIELLMTPERLAAWAKPGVSALLEIETAGSGGEELAIPASAVVRDELTHVFFRRDPKDPDKVIRTEADLGVSDGRWVVVNSGVKAGDEVVLDGVYELKLAGGGKATGGGHFHADGTWHAEPDK